MCLACLLNRKVYGLLQDLCGVLRVCGLDYGDILMDGGERNEPNLYYFKRQIWNMSKMRAKSARIGGHFQEILYGKQTKNNC